MKMLMPFALALALTGCATRPPPLFVAPSLDGFGDAIHHWQNLHGKDYPVWGIWHVQQIADNVLLYQRDNGGWIENRDPTRILSDEEKAQIAGERSNPAASFDNRNVYSQVEYLLGAYWQIGDKRYRDAALRGLDFILSRQYAKCGGWPHTVPSTQSYHDKITIADEVTSGNLRLLRKVAKGEGVFDAVDGARRKRAQSAVYKGDACIVQLQIKQGDTLTGWAGQYDPVTLKPVGGRSFELPAIVSQETVAMIQYLMEDDHPSPMMMEAITCGVAWLRRVRIEGVRIEEVPLPEPVKYQYHTATFDRRLVPDPGGPGLWARFYDLGDSSVVLANRDGVRVASYDQIHPERRSGYGWYGDWPRRLIEVDYVAWKKRVGLSRSPRRP